MKVEYLDLLYRLTQNKKNVVLKWIFGKVWNAQYGDYTERDWEMLEGEKQYDTLKEDDYFDNHHDKDVKETYQ